MDNDSFMLHDRADAGRRLAERLGAYRAQRPVVLALPRGGVPVAFEIAQALGAPLDLILVRKIGAPWQPELALGAVADGEHPDIAVNPAILAELGVPASYVQDEVRRLLVEIKRRRSVYLAGRAAITVQHMQSAPPC
jgi:putative phosphoribosyl transferase